MLKVSKNERNLLPAPTELVLSRQASEPNLPENDLTFVTDPDGTILTYDATRLRQWQPIHQRLEGIDLRQFLIQSRPHWDTWLAGDYDALSESILLPWFDEPDQLPALEWRSLVHKDTYFITLSPIGVPAHSNRMAGICWANLLKHFSGVSYSQRADGTFLFASSSIRSHLGLDLHELEASPQPFFACIHPCDLQELKSKLKRVETEPQDAVTWQYRFQNPRTHKLHFLTDVRKPVYDNEGRLTNFEGVLIDVTQQAAAENLTSGATWQENLSLLISGLAHDFGNVITGLSAASESYAQHSLDNTRLQENLHQIADYSRQANRFIRRILDVSSASQKTRRRGLHNLESLLIDSVDLVQLILGRSAVVTLTTDERELPVYLDAFGFQQMILNFAANTRDALIDVGDIRIQASRIYRDQLNNRSVYIPYGDSDEWVELSFSDNGRGVNEENLDAIFHPFFTTKRPTHGSGLGLYNARAYCAEQEGWVEAKPANPNGLTLVAYFPLLNESQISEHIRNGHYQP